MKSATNEHPFAGHGNGSVRTQNHPLWSPSSSPSHSSASRLEVEIREHGRAGTRAPTPRGHNSLVPDPDRRDVAIVLSGGGINGVLLELGFLQRLRETPFCGRASGGSTARPRERSQGRWPRSTASTTSRTFLARPPPGRRLQAAPDLAVPRRAPRLHAPGDDRRSDRGSRRARRGARRVRDRALRLRDRRQRLPRGGRGRATSSSSTRRTRPSPR